MTRPASSDGRPGIRPWVNGFLVLLLLFASYRPAVCLIAIFSGDRDPARQATPGVANPALRGAQPTPTRQQSRTDPEIRSSLTWTQEEPGPDPRHAAPAPAPVTGKTAALCLRVIIRLNDVVSRPTYLRPDALARPGPLAPPA